MATIPDSLKAADVARFVSRAAQIERAKPVIAYWCNYWVVNQIISKGLHNSDEESIQFTTDLMDKLEQFKTENPDNDAITDNVAGQAYVEQFGLEVFTRADNAVRANKASKQTADTFLAAATFLELCHIWGELDPDVLSKIKFAKYHAVRIARAVKNGEDPNLSNPVVESTTPDAEGDALDPNDPEVQALQGTTTSLSTRERQPSVEEVPDEADRIQRSLAQQSTLDESLHPSRSSSIPPPQIPSATATTSVEEPAVPVLPSTPRDLTLPQVPPTLPDTPGTLPDSSAAFQSFPTPSVPLKNRDQPNPIAPTFPPQKAPAAISAVENRSLTMTASGPSATPASNVDDQSIAQAQKHARWAVSALSFDDVNTAIKELKIALRHLESE
ncbi:Vta1 like-domain-containing protein [Talaromyces proteolyticus]|uniref:Vta1 like-domain-containing protein n=1 Tax=Talaromyces proteolyticus TaxID=1131652 RepID=A0AAD4Q2Q2_9EURO|nr:Vta1 like-domain-containing protein [Talaromyces proteolyticus]KAH8700626.1 Vta1 like-domain-containing protein [Talaromyces proteolyticus]